MRPLTLTIFLFGILIVAGFLRFYQLADAPPGLYPDEAMNGNNALEVLRTGGYKVYYPENNGREGLFIGIQAQFLKVIGKNEPWVLRLPSAIFGLLTVLGMFFLTRELFAKSTKSQASNHKQVPNTNADEQSSNTAASSNLENWNLFGNWDLKIGLSRGDILGLLSSFLIATSFWHINFSRIGFRAIMAPMLLVWSVYFLLLGFRELERTGRLRFAICSLLFAGVLFGFGFYTYIAYRVMPILVLFIFWHYWRRTRHVDLQKQFYIAIGCWLLATFLVSFPIGIYYLQNPADFLGRTAQVSVFSSETPLRDLVLNTVKTLGMFNIAGDGNWRHNFAGRPQLFWPVGLLFIIGMILGIRSLWRNFAFRAALRPSEHGSPAIAGESEAEAPAKPLAGRLGGSEKRNFAYWILFLWFILAMLPVVTSNEGIPHALRAILMLPPVIIFAALGGIWLYEWITAMYQRITNARSSAILRLGAALILSLFALEAYTAYFVRWAPRPETQAEFAANYVEIGRIINALPGKISKYVVVPTGGVLVRGIPMPSQTVMFITDTYLPEQQQEKNVHYLLPDQQSEIPEGSVVFFL